MADQGKVRVTVEGDTSDADIKAADREMAEQSRLEQERSSPAHLRYWIDEPSQRGEAHQQMQRAAERGMAARREKKFVGDLKSRLEGVLNEPPPARKKAAPKRKSTVKRD